MAGVSLLVTFDIRFSLGKVCGLLLGALLLWAVTRWTTTVDRLKLATVAFVAAGAGLAVLGILGTNWMDKFPLFAGVVSRIPRAIRGIPGAEEGFQPNVVAGCLILFVPLQVALLAAPAHLAWSATIGLSRGALFKLELGMLFLTAGTVALTQSRGAWGGLFVAALAALTWRGWRTRLIAAGVVGLLAAAAAILGSGRMIELAVSRSGLGMAGNLSNRVELWSKALDGIQDFALTGMGMNGFRRVLPVLYPTLLTPPDFDVSHAHNHLLQVGLDLGVPGLIAYCALWLGGGGLAVRVYRGGDAIARAVAGGLGAGLIAHFVFSMTDAIPLGAKVGVLFWLTLALLVSWHQFTSRSSAGVSGR